MLSVIPGLDTVIFAVPTDATSEDEIAAFNSDPLTYVVVLGLPFQFTTEPFAKPVPITVRVNPLIPGVTLVGTTGWLTDGTATCAFITLPSDRTEKRIHPRKDLGVTDTSEK
jgi:hypothetical protein